MVNAYVVKQFLRQPLCFLLRFCFFSVTPWKGAVYFSNSLQTIFGIGWSSSNVLRRSSPLITADVSFLSKPVELLKQTKIRLKG